MILSTLSQVKARSTFEVVYVGDVPRKTLYSGGNRSAQDKTEAHNLEPSGLTTEPPATPQHTSAYIMSVFGKTALKHLRDKTESFISTRTGGRYQIYSTRPNFVHYVIKRAHKR